MNLHDNEINLFALSGCQDIIIAKQNNFSGNLFLFSQIKSRQDRSAKDERKMQRTANVDRADPAVGVGDDAMGRPGDGGPHLLCQDRRQW